MLSFKELVESGFVEIKFNTKLKAVYGANISYSFDPQHWNSCSIFLGLDYDTLLQTTFWEWNQAVQFGNVRFSKKVHPVYWNLYLNGLKNFSGNVYLRAEILTGSGIENFETKLSLVPSKAVFFSDWESFLTQGWKIENSCLTITPGEDVRPFALRPVVEGRYKIYFGLMYGIIHMLVSLKDEGIRYPFIAERNRPEFQNKQFKEIYWKSVYLRNDSIIEISPTPSTLREPEKWPFGSLWYIKLVPEKSGHENYRHSLWQNKTLALYFEPYSWAFNYNLDSVQQVEEVMKLYKEMGADQIHNQIIRFGSKTLHYSNIAERHTSGAMRGDNGSLSPGPASMVRSIDILKETIKACKKLGMIHYANAGLTNCYPGTDFEEKISREHPEWRQDNILRYNREETRKYAAAIIREFVQWGTDGVSIDCMRYPYFHTEQDLLLLFYQIHKEIKKFSGRKIPFTVRIPAGNTLYFKVFEKLVKEGIIDCVVPSNLMSKQPIVSLKPYLKWKDYGCKIFGIIDGWLIHMGSYFDFQLSLYRHPSDIKNDIRRFFKEGADGIFVYQADIYCADPFTRNVIDWRKWKRRQE
ncbi:MAG: hypothetical protein NC907_00880 [Candidatus Omnitrophica bacterium]|nr:hypothetical protein [Candidatus Omnitrophota bacterium]